MDYTSLIDQNSNLVLNEDLIRCLGVEQHILLIKVLGWQNFNERAEKKRYCRYGVYWMPAKGTALSSNDIGNINYIKQSERKLKDLVELGVLSEHMETPNNKSRAHRWVRVNLNAFNRFVDLWFKAGKPNAQSMTQQGKKEYGLFLDCWESLKPDFVVAYDPNTPQVIEATPDDSDTTARNKLIGDMIKAWLEAQKAKPAKERNEYQIKATRDVMDALIDKGITPQVVADYVGANGRPDFYVSLYMLNNNVIGWYESRRPKATGLAALDLQDESPLPAIDDELSDEIAEIGGLFNANSN